MPAGPGDPRRRLRGRRPRPGLHRLRADARHRGRRRPARRRRAHRDRSRRPGLAELLPGQRPGRAGLRSPPPRRTVPKYRAAGATRLDLPGAAPRDGGARRRRAAAHRGPRARLAGVDVGLPRGGPGAAGRLRALQRRLAAGGGSPIVPPVLWTQPGFTPAVVTVVAFYATVASTFLVLALYLQGGSAGSARWTAACCSASWARASWSPRRWRARAARRSSASAGRSSPSAPGCG